MSEHKIRLLTPPDVEPFIEFDITLTQGEAEAIGKWGDAIQQWERSRIIKLLIDEGILKPRTNENEEDQQIIALIKGEQE